MKKILLLIITLFLTAQTIKAQTVVLDVNGVTVKWTGTTVPSPYFVQANPRGTGMEWFAIVNNTTKSNITAYAKNIQSGITYFKPPSSTTPIPFNNIVTTLVTDMSYMFTYSTPSNNVVTTLIFNENICSWDVSNVINMNYMFYITSFNQPIGSWNVGNVTTMNSMFRQANAFNQPIGSWNVGNVTQMFNMFNNANSFNQPIGSWNVSNVTNMRGMFNYAYTFNQNIGTWNVGNVTTMDSMFFFDIAFNQPIGSWNVSNVTDMRFMFYEANAFNQPIGSWNVGNVKFMDSMFGDATAFNQPIGNWNVSNVINMSSMFTGAQLSINNYDALLIGWSTIAPNETPLKPNVFFDVDNSKYCNGASARASIISTYGWTITDAGLDCTSLDTETFDAISIKLYPNPVINNLNVKVDSNLINQPYTIIDGLGRVVLNGKLNDVDTTITVEQLSKGIYYLKVSDNIANKFVKE
jgi:surface protein